MKTLLLVITLLTCNIISAQIPHGIYVSPKDYQPFFNYYTEGLVETLGDTSTMYLKKKKAFGEYVFDLQDSIVQFWVRGQLLSESNILFIVWWYDPYENVLKGEISKKVHIQYMMREK